MFVLLLALLVLPGCATPKIDWGARVGTYTYDQAVLELGPPDKRARLEDGTVVAEWLTRRGYARTYAVFGYGGAPWYYGPAYTTYADTYSPDYYLRLIFAPDGKLKSWKKFAR